MAHGTPLDGVGAAGKPGTVDRNRALKIPLKLDSAGLFSEGLATVALHGRAAPVDESGEVVSGEEILCVDV